MFYEKFSNIKAEKLIEEINLVFSRRLLLHFFICCFYF